MAETSSDPFTYLRQHPEWQRVITTPSIGQADVDQTSQQTRALSIMVRSETLRTQTAKVEAGVQSCISDPFQSLKDDPRWAQLTQRKKGGALLTDRDVVYALCILKDHITEMDKSNSEEPPSIKSMSDCVMQRDDACSSQSSFSLPSSCHPTRVSPPRLTDRASVSHTPNTSQRRDELDHLLATPTLWGGVVKELNTLKNKSWVATDVMNFYLLVRWSELRTTAETYFVDIDFAHKVTPVDDDEVATFRRRYTDQKTPLRRVTFIAHHANHWFAVVFDYGISTAWLLGAQHMREGYFEKDVIWDEWGGRRAWQNVAKLFQWHEDVTEDAEHVIGLDWRQNGYDCGPIAVEVVLSVLKYNLQADDTGHIQKPVIRCGHQIRQEMLAVLQEDVYRSFKLWHQIKDVELVPQADDGHLDDTVVIMTNNHIWTDLIRRVSVTLGPAQARCLECRLAIHNGATHIGHAAMTHTHRTKGSSEHSSSSDPQSLDPITQSHGRNKHPNISPGAPPSRLTKRLKSRHDTQNYVTRNVDSIAHAKGAPAIPKQTFIPLDHVVDFDDYHNGPTIEDLEDFPNTPLAAGMRMSPWESFKDYGYRLEPSFALMFNQQDPILVEAHILPRAQRRLHDNTHVTGDYTLQRDRQRSGKEKGRQKAKGSTPNPITVTVDDVQTMGLQDMLAEARGQDAHRNIDVFVMGQTRWGEYIAVDPEQDEIHLAEDEVHTVIDIDSVIWVTYNLHFRQALKVFVFPLEGPYPPFHHNNQVYVDILLPRSDDDKAQGQRQEWWSKKFPISTIPHTHFAHFGVGAGSVNIAVFFPRMIHRQHFSRYPATKIPHVVQALWISEVVLPAIKTATDHAFHPYVDFTMEEWKFKATRKRGFSVTQTVAVLDTELSTLQSEMRAIIEKKGDELDLYGSFFFVADVRGCKGITHGDDPYTNLQKQYPAFDWEYAMHRENGQLILDLGITFSPKPLTQQPLVGLWRHDVMHPSYDKAGMNKPIIHRCSTLRDYGGLQATMEINRSKAVQIRFLSSYMLSFECIRRPSSGIDFCEDSVAYEASTSFNESCKSYVAMFQGAKARAFGVRHEIRASGPAIKDALLSVQTRARTFLMSKPILWIPSDIWFDFLTARMTALMHTQLKLARLQPPNYGILTSLIMHLIRFVPNTPRVMHDYLRRALVDVQFDPVMSRFGMFFLHGLDLKTGRVEGIEEEDDAEVKNVMKLAKKTRRRKQAAKGNSAPDAQYPYGDAPSWTVIVQALRDAPETLMRAWSWNDVWSHHETASQLFVQMTIDIWLTLTASCLSALAPHPSNLEEAMNTWTITAIQEIFYNPTFLASNAGLDGGRTGQKQPTFASMVDIFFPAPSDGPAVAKSTWKPLVERGYIKEFHRRIKSHTKESMDHVLNALRLIFKNIQCLPPAQPCINEKKPGRLWKTSDGMMEIMTNPEFYRLRCVGTNQRKKTISTRVKASNAMICARLDEEHRGVPYKKGRPKAYRNARQSAKTRNYRKPPTNPGMKKKLKEAQKPVTSQSDGDTSGESEIEAEESSEGSEMASSEEEGSAEW